MASQKRLFYTLLLPAPSTSSLRSGRECRNTVINSLGFTLTTNNDPVPTSIPDIDDYVLVGIRICINYASQVGASIVLLVVLLLTARPDKHTSAIFILGALALLFNVYPPLSRLHWPILRSLQRLFRGLVRRPSRPVWCQHHSILLVCLLLTACPDKRTSLIHVLNALAVLVGHHPLMFRLHGQFDGFINLFFLVLMLQSVAPLWKVVKPFVTPIVKKIFTSFRQFPKKGFNPLFTPRTKPAAPYTGLGSDDFALE